MNVTLYTFYSTCKQTRTIMDSKHNFIIGIAILSQVFHTENHKKTFILRKQSMEIVSNVTAIPTSNLSSQ